MNDSSVPFQNFRAAYDELKPELDEAYHRFMESGWYVLGQELAAFEVEYAAFCESPHCVGVANGLEALHLALRALNVSAGDEVIVPSNTYIATWLGVSQTGGIPVPVEPDPVTYNLDPARVEAAITPNTKVIMAVNLYGQPCDYDALLAIARKHGLKLAIDNAQAHGARYKGRRVGGIADIECHSFYPSKNLGAYGEAGAITTADTALADQIRLLRNYGSKVRYHNEIVGYNSRLDELQAAFLRVKLRHLDAWNARRTAIAERYLSQLSTLNSQLILPAVPEWASPVWHLFVIRHPRRDQLQQHLTGQGIQTIIHYPIPPHLSGAYASFSGARLPVAEQLAGEVLSLPMGPHMAAESVATVTRALADFSAD
ncbi:MAG TPA: DegT/DnrJ/EryC1/StrS family aminotransferase [Luteolibacter sp.]